MACSPKGKFLQKHSLLMYSFQISLPVKNLVKKKKSNNYSVPLRDLSGLIKKIIIIIVCEPLLILG